MLFSVAGNFSFPEGETKQKRKNLKKPLPNEPGYDIITKLRFGHGGYSSAGRALEWHSRGQQVRSAYLHQAKSLENILFSRLLLFLLSRSVLDEGTLFCALCVCESIGWKTEWLLFMPKSHAVRMTVIVHCAYG